jgi:hypothetical protein
VYKSPLLLLCAIDIRYPLIGTLLNKPGGILLTSSKKRVDQIGEKKKTFVKRIND